MTLWHNLEDITIGQDEPRSKFIAILKKIVELVNADRALYEFLFFVPRSFASEEINKAEWKQFQLRLYNVLLELIKEGIKQGQFPQMEPQLVMKALGGLFHGMVFWGKDETPVSEEALEEMLDSMLKMN